MFKNPSLVTRIAVGKLVGMALGLVGLMAIPYLWPDLGWICFVITVVLFVIWNKIQIPFLTHLFRL